MTDLSGQIRMKTENENAPSVDSATTHFEQSNDTTPDMSVHGNIDPEKGVVTPREKDETQSITDNSTTTPPAPATPGVGPPPDGGMPAWLSVLGAFCGLFVSFGWINCKPYPLPQEQFNVNLI